MVISAARRSKRVPVKRRAVTDSLKNSRREVILAAAQELFCKKTFESITIGTIAAHPGRAKGTL